MALKSEPNNSIAARAEHISTSKNVEIKLAKASIRQNNPIYAWNSDNSTRSRYST